MVLSHPENCDFPQKYDAPPPEYKAHLSPKGLEILPHTKNKSQGTVHLGGVTSGDASFAEGV